MFPRSLPVRHPLAESLRDGGSESNCQAQAPDSHSPPSSEGSPPKEQREKAVLRFQVSHGLTEVRLHPPLENSCCRTESGGAAG